MKRKAETDALDLTSLLNGWCFSPQSLYWYEPLQESLSANSSFCKQLWLLWSSSQRFLSES